MRMTGYCESCHRIRAVRVNMSRWHGNVPVGICTQCEDAQHQGTTR